MTYKETLFFVAKCLTINHEAHNKRIVEQAIQSNTVDWDKVVKLSTAHYVFPALYCNLKRASFLSYLPNDLVDYMKYITELNRERNEQIIAQARELNTLLLEHNITPIFIKGTGNLLEGLYEDIAERMVGDIDFICSPEDYPKAVQLLKKNGYINNQKEYEKRLDDKHYPRLISNSKIAAVEIHFTFLREKFRDELNYNFIKESIQLIQGVSVLSFKYQLLISIAAHQINDFGFENNSLALRNAYDVFLLSKKTIAKNAFINLNNLKHPLNCFLASCYEVFNKPDSLQYYLSNQTHQYLILFYKYLKNRDLSLKNRLKVQKKRNMRMRLLKLYKCLFYKEYRNWFINCITDKNWRKEKLIQLGIKKP